MRSLTEKEKEQIIQLYESGYGNRRIASEVGRDRSTIKRYLHTYKAYGTLTIHPTGTSKYPPDVKLSAVKDVMEKSISLEKTRVEYGIPDKKTLRNWVRIARTEGYEALYMSENKRKRCVKPPVDETALEQLRRENYELRLENALLKKVKALVEERESRLKGTGQKPSKD